MNDNVSSHQPAPLMEVDGVVTGDFFTVLCVGQSYTEDQWMNMYTFSMIRSWLLTYDTDGTSNAETGSFNGADIPNLSVYIICVIVVGFRNVSICSYTF